jgi:hypothetical protein
MMGCNLYIYSGARCSHEIKYILWSRISYRCCPAVHSDCYLVPILCCTVPVYKPLCIQNKPVLCQLLSSLRVHSGDPKSGCTARTVLSLSLSSNFVIFPISAVYRPSTTALTFSYRFRFKSAKILFSLDLGAVDTVISLKLRFCIVHLYYAGSPAVLFTAGRAIYLAPFFHSCCEVYFCYIF